MPGIHFARRAFTMPIILLYAVTGNLIGIMYIEYNLWSDILPCCVSQAHAKLLDPVNYASIESDLTWLGVAGLLDPPRPEVRKAIQDCNLAGIRVSHRLLPRLMHLVACFPPMSVDREHTYNKASRL